MRNFGTFNMPKQIHYKEIDVENALLEMGLDKAGLVEAVRYAETEHSFCTYNDAVGFASYVVYDKAARRLRELYLPKDWIKDDSSNQAAIRNPDTMIRVVPCNFNEYAGNRLVTPTNKSPKGEVSRNKSACNRTAWLPGVPDIEPESNDGYLTWLLGIHIDDSRPTGAELSFPVAFDGNYFTSFGMRILLLSGDDDGGRIGVPKSPDDDAVEIVDIAIKQR